MSTCATSSATSEREVDEFGFDVVVASSGTAESLAHITHAARGEEPLKTYNCATFTASELHAATTTLAKLRRPEDRLAVPGLEAARTDIAVAGAIILDTVAETFGVEEVMYSEAALRDGVLVDTLGRLNGDDGQDGLHHLRDVSRRSIRQLAERCDDDPTHSAHVAQLALQLFDQLRPVHGLDATAREYLEAGALLANVGLVVAHTKHHLHAYYVIRNSELAGLTDAEIEVIAQIARYHRKSAPKPSHAEFAALAPENQALVRSLAGILRVAIGLDRSHRGRVASVRADIKPKRITVFVAADPAVGADIGLELYAANERKELLEADLGRRIDLIPAP